MQKINKRNDVVIMNPRRENEKLVIEMLRLKKKNGRLKNLVEIEGSIHSEMWST